MPTTYEAAPERVASLIVKMLQANHPDLAETGCTVGALFASNEKGPAVKHHGTAALAKVRIVSADKRVNNVNDAEIVIDAGEWSQLSDEQQIALVDQQLAYLRRKEYSEKSLAKLRKEDPNHIAWKLDEHGRPKLGTVPPDMSAGGAFAEVIARHGENAVEFENAKRFHEFARQAMQRGR